MENKRDPQMPQQPTRTKPPLPKDQLLTVVNADLVRILTAMYPDHLPEGEYDLRKVDVLVGEQNVIRALKNALRRIENPERP